MANGEWLARGDVVTCCDATDHILVNGQPLEESAYTQGNNTTSSRTLGFTSVTVPQGQLLAPGRKAHCLTVPRHEAQG